MNLIMRVFGHYEPLETPRNLIMIVSLIIRRIMRLLTFQCVHTIKVLDATHGVGQENSPWLVDDDKSEGGATVWQSDKSWPFAYVGSGNEETCGSSFPSA